MAISWSVIFPRLPSKVPFAIVWNEKSADGPIGIVRAKVALALVEAAELAIWTPCFEDRSRGRRVSQFLRQPQILRPADVAELGSVLGIMLIELRAASESGSAGKKQQRG